MLIKIIIYDILPFQSNFHNSCICLTCKRFRILFHKFSTGSIFYPMGNLYSLYSLRVALW